MNKEVAGGGGSSERILGAAVEIDVPFYDLDPLGVVWHGHYYKYFELARMEFMRSIGFDMDEMRRSGYVWPVTKSHCSHIAPLRYPARAVVRAELREEAHRLILGYRITEKETGRLLAKGHTEQVAVQMDSWEICFSTPAALLDRLRAAREKIRP